MKTIQSIICWTVAASFAAWVTPQALAQEEENPDKITEQDKKTFQDAVKALTTPSAKSRQTHAVMNARQIGLAMFEFETEYGEFPNEKTAKTVKEVTETKAEIKAVTANDCLFQLIAANIVESDRMFSLEIPAAAEKQEKRKPLEKLAKCSFAYLTVLNAAGNPSRPLVVAPLVNGETVFDPKVLGGRAVVLRVDNSVTTIPIEKDGRVLIDGMDMFDPAQPFWNGKVPPIKWPEQ